VLFLLAASCSTAGARIERQDVLDGYLREAPRRPLLVVDLDDTVVRGGFPRSLRLYLRLFYSGVSPIEGAPEALKKLKEQWDLVFVTARDDCLDGPTMAWLEKQGFPRAPVVFSQSILWNGRSRADFKTRAIADLIRSGLSPGWGVGDKATDMTAYRANGLHTALILEDPLDPDLGRALDALGVRRFGPLAPPGGPPLPDVVLIGHDRAWAEIADLLSGRAAPGDRGERSPSP